MELDDRQKLDPYSLKVGPRYAGQRKLGDSVKAHTAQFMISIKTQPGIDVNIIIVVQPLDN